MKKIALLLMMLCVLVTVCGALSGCDDDRAGTYRLCSATMDGTLCDEQTLELLGLNTSTLTLNNDSTCSIVIYGETAEGTWDDTTVTISGAEYEATWDKNILTIVREGGQMSFEKAE